MGENHHSEWRPSSETLAWQSVWPRRLSITYTSNRNRTFFSFSLSLSLARSRLWNWMDRFYRCARIKRRVDTVSFSSTKTGKLFPARENELRWKKKEKKRKEKLAAWLFSRDESSLRKVEPHTTKVATTYRSHSMERLARFRALERWSSVLRTDSWFFAPRVYRVHSNFSFLSSLPPSSIRYRTDVF